MNHEAHLQRIIHFYESLRPENVREIGNIYAADCQFKDPFNEVRGIAAIADVFRRMFEQVEAPRFLIGTQVMQGDDAFLTWDFRFRLRGSATDQCIRGATHLRFDQDGLVRWHRDYWDAAEELYEKLPVLGSLMRLLKRATSN